MSRTMFYYSATQDVTYKQMWDSTLNGHTLVALSTNICVAAHNDTDPFGSTTNDAIYAEMYFPIHVEKYMCTQKVGRGKGFQMSNIATQPAKVGQDDFALLIRTMPRFRARWISILDIFFLWICWMLALEFSKLHIHF